MDSDKNSVKEKNTDDLSYRIDFKYINKEKQKKILTKQNDNIKNLLSDMIKNEDSNNSEVSEEFTSEISYYRKKSSKKGKATGGQDDLSSNRKQKAFEMQNKAGIIKVI
jgi:hypothetical protein